MAGDGLRLVPGGVRYHDWRVTDTGAITVRVNIMEPFPPGARDIGPFFTVDTDEAARLGRENGGQRYLDRYPGASLQMESSVIAGTGRWEMKFRVSSLTDSCVVPIVINAQTGELVSRDTSCLDRQTPS